MSMNDVSGGDAKNIDGTTLMACAAYLLYFCLSIYCLLFNEVYSLKLVFSKNLCDSFMRLLTGKHGSLSLSLSQHNTAQAPDPTTRICPNEAG